MDWLEDFIKRFGKDERLKHLKNHKFHGNLKLNFFNGCVNNLQKEEAIKYFVDEKREKTLLN